MEVILLERVGNLGQMGDVVNVKPGFARNYLIPQNKALRATEKNRRHFEEQWSQLEAANLQHKSEAEKIGAKLDGLIVLLIRQAGDTGQLYGSVNARDIAGEVTEAGFTISRQQVKLAQPIKALGLHRIRIDLHSEVSAGVIANVARSDEEAKLQAKTGKAVVGSDEEERIAEEEAARKAALEAEKVFEEGAAPTAEELMEEAAGDLMEDAATQAAEKAAEEKAEAGEEAAAEKEEKEEAGDNSEQAGEKEG
ncbi:MAG TPA: 50S ribosomal protein L9 [Rhodospirillaceae bacterium]|jgi:large subunit ribosomal protein L9|nr:50S ribosomal protein L9 [Rhodospirillaceae bacterium]HIJ44583.1 50S ribosomal protein L9 [Rhodospirillaceae bacterium]HIJ93150.1 50S ribosomal protein L9 [Rhodospirillaceae bacterium]